jgi:hypothetical protein
MLKSLFLWLDSHPSSYWVVSLAATALLLGGLLVALWREAGATGGLRRATWRDGLAVFLFLLAWRWPFLLAANDYNPDESQLIAGAMTLTHDPVFWRSVDGTTSGPLNFYVLLPLHWLGLPLDYFSARLTGLLLIAGALFACLYALAHRFGRAAAWIGILPTAVFFATVTHGDLIHFSSEHTTLLLLAVAAGLLATREPADRWRLWLALLCAGAAPWAKMQTVPPAAVLIGWGAWQVFTSTAAARARVRGLAGAALVALAPTLLVLATTLASGQLEHAWRRYFLHNLLYVQVTDQTVAEAVERMFGMALLDGRFPLLLGTAAVGLLAAIVYFVGRRVRPPVLFVIGALLCLAAAFAVIVPRREFLHYLLLLPVPIALLLGGAVGGWWTQPGSAGARRLIACLLLAAGALPPVVTRCRQPLPDIYGNFAYHWAHPRSPVAMVVRALSGGHGPLGVWGWATHLYVEAGLRQATRDPHSVWDIIATPQRDYHRAIYLEDLRRSAPAVFVDAVGPGAFCFEHRSQSAHEIFPELAEYVRDNYLLVRDVGEARIYARRGSAGLDQVSALQIDALLARGRGRTRDNLLGTAVTPLEQLTRKEIDGRTVTMLLPPAAVEWKLDEEVREVTVDFGFDPVAYASGGGNGAELVVELVSFANSRPVYRRMLDPVRLADDRGPQSARITLPPFSPDTRLVVRTEPGPHGDNAWDWVYLAGLQFHRSPRFVPAQFPGFNRTPDQADTPNAIVTGEGAAAQLLLHAPATLNYALEGGESRLQFDYGLRAGAYSDGGRTDGAGFRVELHPPGQPARVLFERLLQPARKETDRGTQRLDLKLPAAVPGTRLLISIDCGPSGNGAWDWTYLENLRLR